MERSKVVAHISNFLGFLGGALLGVGAFVWYVSVHLYFGMSPGLGGMPPLALVWGVLALPIVVALVLRFSLLRGTRVDRASILFVCSYIAGFLATALWAFVGVNS